MGNGLRLLGRLLEVEPGGKDNATMGVITRWSVAVRERIVDTDIAMSKGRRCVDEFSPGQGGPGHPFCIVRAIEQDEAWALVVNDDLSGWSPERGVDGRWRRKDHLSLLAGYALCKIRQRVLDRHLCSESVAIRNESKSPSLVVGCRKWVESGLYGIYDAAREITLQRVERLDPINRKLIWDDGKPVSVDESVQRTGASYPELPVELIHSHLVGWLAMGELPGDLPTDQMETRWSNW